MYKKIILIVGIVFLCLNLVNAQPIKSKVESYHESWNYGFLLSGAYNGVTKAENAQYKFGYKAGFIAEKRLIYFLYFQPCLSFVNRSFSYTRPFEGKLDVNAYIIEGVANIALKFGDHIKNRGLIIYISPYISYGIGGKTIIDSLSKNNEIVINGQIEEKTFSDKMLNAFDIGFFLGLGYDINEHWGLSLGYIAGMQRIMNYSGNRWKGFQFQINYFL
ncbi:MAG: outer membrane beta-barrel protein [Bacteroidales bacterium]|jgi:hypothetical protein|nr:outer membrane beta-barrel protein [Bacteroidales bacterium]